MALSSTRGLSHCMLPLRTGTSRWCATYVPAVGMCARQPTRQWSHSSSPQKPLKHNEVMCCLRSALHRCFWQREEGMLKS
eukprot:g25896.t1